MRNPPRGLLVDLDGTIYEDREPIPGAAAAIGALRDEDVPIRFVTNTTRVSRSTIAGWLDDLGILAEDDDVFTPLVAAAAWLRDRDVRRLMLCLPEDSRLEFSDFQAVEEDPEAVVVGDLGRGWTFEVMNRVLRALLEGAQLIALHRNRYWKTGGELVLDVGAFVAAFEYATSSAATVVGKPSRAMFVAAARSMGLELADIAMVGDDLQVDVGGSQALGIRGFLVRTGKYRGEDFETSEIQPDLVIDSIAQLPGLLLR